MYSLIAELGCLGLRSVSMGAIQIEERLSVPSAPVTTDSI